MVIKIGVWIQKGIHLFNEQIKSSFDTAIIINLKWEAKETKNPNKTKQNPYKI